MPFWERRSPRRILDDAMIRVHEVSCSDDCYVADSCGGDVYVSVLAHGKIVFVVKIESALSVPIRFGQIGVVGSDDVGLRHVATFLLRKGETIWK